MLKELGFHKTAGWLSKYLNSRPIRELTDGAIAHVPMSEEAATRFTRKQLANKAINAQRGMDRLTSFAEHVDNPFINPTRRKVNPWTNEEKVLRIKNYLIPTLEDAKDRRESWIRQALRHRSI